MRTFSAVTTCHQKGYELYGRSMVQTFDQYWPEDVELYLYAEGFAPDVKSERIINRDLLAECPELVAFKKRHADSPLAQGLQDRPFWQVRFDWRKLKLKIRRKRGQGYRWDAVRFSHKVFAIFDAAKRCPSDVLFWLDADIRFLTALPSQFLEELVPPDSMLSYLMRPTFSECGFVAYNLRHPAIREFLTQFEELYTTDSLFKERQWHDSYLFDVVKKRFERQGHKTYDIGEGVGRTTGHIFVNSKLGKYMDHVKGDRKIDGKSRERDLKITTG